MSFHLSVCRLWNRTVCCTPAGQVTSPPRASISSFGKGREKTMPAGCGRAPNRRVHSLSKESLPDGITSGPHSKGVTCGRDGNRASPQHVFDREARVVAQPCAKKPNQVDFSRDSYHYCRAHEVVPASSAHHVCLPLEAPAEGPRPSVHVCEHDQGSACCWDQGLDHD